MTAVGSTSVFLLLGSNVFDQVHHSVTVAILIVIPVKHIEKLSSENLEQYLYNYAIMHASAKLGQWGSDSMNTNTSMTLLCPSRFDGVVIPYLGNTQNMTTAHHMKVKSAHEPSDPSGWTLSQVL